MSLASIDTTIAQPTPALGAQAAAARVAELQQLIAQAQGRVPSNGGASFSAALASASSVQPAAASATPFVSTTLPGSNVTAGAPGTTPYDSLVTSAAQRYGLDPAILHGLIQQESGFNPNATSGAGALGLTQLMPGTAAGLGVTNPLDPAQSIDGGARYLRRQLDAFGGDVVKALAAYNAGPSAVSRYGGVPPYAETQAYVQKVLANANAYRNATGVAPTPTPLPSA
ncbi:MAG TPA: lytic transglycosylase domain-containing protein [Conexibacter sp.]|nr:lytic transglycosylase domain-containing protein [Conexibacter sp.]